MAHRLPIPGSDDGDWGAILNDYLEVSLNNDGSLNTAAVSNALPNPIPAVNLGTGTPSSSNFLRGDGSWVNLPVSSVFGRTGAVIASSGDYTADQVGALSAVSDLSSIASTNATVDDVSLNNHRLTNLQNGVNSSDAAAIGQMPVIGAAGSGADNALSANDPTTTNSRAPNGSAGGDLSGTFPNPAVSGVNNIPVNITSPNDGDVLTYIAADSAIENKPAPAGGAFALTPIVVTSDVTAVSGQIIIAGGHTITAPSNPSAGDCFGVTSVMGTNTVLVDGSNPTVPENSTMIFSYFDADPFGTVWFPVLLPPPSTVELQTYAFTILTGDQNGTTNTVLVGENASSTIIVNSGIPITVAAGNIIATPQVNPPSWSTGTVNIDNILLAISNASGTEKLIIGVVGPIEVTSSADFNIDFGTTPNIHQQVGTDIYWEESSLSVKSTAGGEYFVNLMMQILTSSLSY